MTRSARLSAADWIFVSPSFNRVAASLIPDPGRESKKTAEQNVAVRTGNCNRFSENGGVRALLANTATSSRFLFVRQLQVVVEQR